VPGIVGKVFLPQPDVVVAQLFSCPYRVELLLEGLGMGQPLTTGPPGEQSDLHDGLLPWLAITVP
jgi:hypothetical protein